MTAYESYKKIESEVRFQTNLLEKPQLSEKCPIHQFNYSKSCRQCKKIVVEEVPTYQERAANMDKYYYDQGDRGDNLLPIHGENAISNMNSLIRQNILTCPYYRDVQQIRDINDIITEIDKIVTNVETWAGPGVPSSFFCILYKLMTMNLTVKQLQVLNSWHLNPYVRCIGLLYIRYALDPNFLWGWMKKYILDEQEFKPTKEETITIGEYCERLLTDLNYYNTRLPRIPQQIDTVIQAKILLAREKRERRLINIRLVSLFQPGAQVRAISSYDDEWHVGTIESFDGTYLMVLFERDKEKVNLGEIEFMPKNDEQRMFIATMITQGIQEGQIEMPQQVVQPKSLSKSRSRSKNSNKKHQKHKKKDKKQDKKKDKKKHSDKHSERHSSPEMAKYESNKERQERLEKEIRKKQMDKCVANSRQDVAKIPASYKTSLSAALPSSQNKPVRPTSPTHQRKEQFVELGTEPKPQDPPQNNYLKQKYGSTNLEQSDKINNDYL